MDSGEKTTVKPAAKNPMVKLKKPHTHKGQYYDQAAVNKGVEITVSTRQQKWLKEQGVI